MSFAGIVPTQFPSCHISNVNRVLTISNIAFSLFLVSADYWKLKKDGSIAYDGRADLYAEDGDNNPDNDKKIKSTAARGIESSLVELLVGKNATDAQKLQVQNLMLASGLGHTIDPKDPNNRDKWSWNQSQQLEKSFAGSKWTENVNYDTQNMGKSISAYSILSDFGDTVAKPIFDQTMNDKVNRYLYEDSSVGLYIPQKAFQRFIDKATKQNKIDQNNNAIIDNLHPAIKNSVKEFIVDSRNEGYILEITSGYRTFEEQAEIYAKGRDKDNNKIGITYTNAKAGESFHNYGLAIDVRNVNGSENNKALADIGARYNLEWGGYWDDPYDPPHFQNKFNNKITDLYKKYLKGGQANNLDLVK